MTSSRDDGRHAFAFQTGHWRVRHHKLKRRLAGETGWWSFDGECRAFEILGGAGNIDDHLIPDPTGSYRAATLRVLDVKTAMWTIYWADQRLPDLAAPMRGRFIGDRGVFYGDDELAGRAIKVRFIWSSLDTGAPRWEQAFSVDDGQAWETNWTMDFEPAGDRLRDTGPRD